MLNLTYQYTKVRSALGRQPLFCEQGPEMCDSIIRDPREFRHYILRNPVHQFAQNSICFSAHDVNTLVTEYVEQGINHSEGGWPKDVHCTDVESTQRYRRKIEKEDTYYHCVMAGSKKMNHYVKQNNAVDMYQLYYTEMKKQPPLERSCIRMLNTYRDPRMRPVSSISWQPEHGHKFAVSYGSLKHSCLHDTKVECYLWDVETSHHTDTQLDPPCTVLDLQYSNRDPQLLVAGLANGQVAQFDPRANGAPKQLCPLHVAHGDMVRAVKFINSKTGMEFFSGSTDGCCKWWDLRNMSNFTDMVILQLVEFHTDQPSFTKSNSLSVLEFEHSIPMRYMAGTDNGYMMSGNRKGKTALERLPHQAQLHSGPVLSLERSPGFMKHYLSVGDWSAKIWTEDCREQPLLWTPLLRRKPTFGTWSPTRLSLLVVSDIEGKLAFWDLLRRQHEPIFTVNISKSPLTKLRYQEGGTLLNIGNTKGRVYMTEMSPNLAVSDANDKQLLTAMFEREGRRAHILDARLREIKLLRRVAEGGGSPPYTSTMDLSELTAGDRDLTEATNNYMQEIKKELANLFHLRKYDQFSLRSFVQESFAHQISINMDFLS